MTHVQKETAVLLKEKGYNVPNNNYYAIGGNSNNFIESESVKRKDFNGLGEYYFTRPTLYEATEWLRAKGVHVALVPTFRKSTWDFQYFIYNNETKCWDLGEKGNWSYPTHDQALEAGIIHALKNYVK